MPIPVRLIQPKVMLDKANTVHGRGAYGTYELNLPLGEGASIRTSKSVNEPFGSCTITLLDLPTLVEGIGADSLYAMVSPMDMIRVYLEELLWFRGFVSEVRRDESMGSDGRPSRRVIIVCHDIGKVLTTFQINYIIETKVAEKWVPNMATFRNYAKDGNKALSAHGAVTKMVELFLNPFLAEIREEAISNGATEAHWMELTPDVTVSGVVPASCVNWPGGSVYEFLRYYLDIGAWNELFVEDYIDEEKPRLVVRANPYYSIMDGTKCLDDAIIPHVCELTDLDVISRSAARSDAHVANFFWAWNNGMPMGNELHYKNQLLGAEKDNYITFDYLPSWSKLFSWRPMQSEFRMLPDDSIVADAPTPEQQERNRPNFVEWTKRRAVELRKQNQDNSLMERGTLRLIGNLQVRAGCMLFINRANSPVNTPIEGQTFKGGHHYIVSVEHDWSWGGFLTTAQYERGTDWGSPNGFATYFDEVDVKGVY